MKIAAHFRTDYTRPSVAGVGDPGTGLGEAGYKEFGDNPRAAYS